LDIDEKSFLSHLEEQKNRSRAAATVDTDDWIFTAVQWRGEKGQTVEFVGYETLECESYITFVTEK
jgi:alanyl-tRNA synthetase